MLSIPHHVTILLAFAAACHAATPFSCDLGILSSALRIEQLAPQVALGFMEIEIYDNNGNNVAREGLVSLSSIEDTYAAPQNCNDGVTTLTMYSDGVKFQDSRCSTTYGSVPAWIDVTLDSLTCIMGITLYSRMCPDAPGACEGFNNGAVVKLMRPNGRVAFSYTIENAPVPGTLPLEIVADAQYASAADASNWEFKLLPTHAGEPAVGLALVRENSSAPWSAICNDFAQPKHTAEALCEALGFTQAVNSVIILGAAVSYPFLVDQVSCEYPGNGASPPAFPADCVFIAGAAANASCPRNSATYLDCRPTIGGEFPYLRDKNPQRSFFPATCDLGSDTMILYGGRRAADSYMEMSLVTTVLSTGYTLKTTVVGSPALASAGLVLYKGRLFLFFGEDSDGNFSPVIYVLNPAVPTRWVALQIGSTSRPSARSRFSYALMDPSQHNGMRARLIMAFGVADSGVTNEVWSMEIESITTTEGPWILEHDGVSSEAPTPRVDACCSYLVFSDRLANETHNTADRRYWRMTCFGGRDAAGDTNDLWAFDFRTNDPGPNAVNGSPTPATTRWTKLVVGGSIPSPRFGAQCAMAPVDLFAATADGTIPLAIPRLVVVGGMSSETGSAVTDSAIYIFEYQTYTWRMLPLTDHPSVSERAYGFMCPIKQTGQFYITGGMNGPDDLSGELYTIILDEKPRSVSTLSTALAEKQTLDGSPNARDSHCAFLIGTRYFIAFGRDDTTVYDDIWELENADTVLSDGAPVWAEVHTHSDAAPKGRYGATCVTYGTTLYVFGGSLSSEPSSQTNELWSLDFLTLTWHLAQQSNPPTPRAYAGGVLFNNSLLLYGGETLFSSASSDLLAYVFSYQAWVAVDVEGNGTSLGERSRHMMMLDTATSEEVHVLGGWDAGGAVVASRIVFSSLIVSTGRDLTATITAVLRGAPASTPAAAWVRAEGAGIFAAGITYVFGGMLTSRLPPAFYDSAYVLHGAGDGVVDEVKAVSVLTTSVAYTNLLEGVSYRAVALSTATHRGDAVIIFGGRILAEHRKTTLFTSRLQLYTPDICPGNTTSTTTVCVPCSAGYFQSAGGVCTAAPAGTYITNSLKGPKLCSKGSANPWRGGVSSANCAVCGAGTYAPSKGLSKCLPCGDFSCAIAETALRALYTNDSFSLDLLLNTSSDNAAIAVVPALSVAMSPPNFILLTILCVALVSLAIILATIGLESFFSRRKVKKYINAEAAELLQGIYDKLEVPGYGLDRTALYNCLLEIITATGGARISNDLSCDLFRQYDDDGSGFISEQELIQVCITLIRKGLMVPFPGTAAWDARAKLVNELPPPQGGDYEASSCNVIALGPDQDEGGPEKLDGDKSPPIVAPEKDKQEGEPEASGWERFLDRLEEVFVFRWANLDGFTTNHQIGNIGDPLRIQSNTVGGIASFVKIFVALLLAVLLLIVFLYSNIVETKSSLPSVLMNATAVPDRLTVRAISFEDSKKSSCVDPATLACAATSYVDSGIHSEQFLQTTACTYTDGSSTNTLSSCTIEWNCYKCTFPSDFEASILLRFSDASASHRLYVEVEATTGIIDPVVHPSGTVDFKGPPQRVSKVVARYLPRESRLLRGFPATTLGALLTPTFFESVSDSSALNKFGSSGLHTQLEFGSNITGNTVDNSTYTNTLGVPVQVNLRVDTVAYRVTRTAKQELITLFSSILGAVGGVGAAILALVQFIDSRQQAVRQAAFEKALEKEQEKPAGSSGAIPAADVELLRPLVTSKVSYSTAQEILNLIRNPAVRQPQEETA